MDILEVESKSNSQVINIPEKFRIDDDRVYIKQVGRSIVLTPYHSPWADFFNSANRVSDDFMEDGREQGEDQEREV